MIDLKALIEASDDEVTAHDLLTVIKINLEQVRTTPIFSDGRSAAVGIQLSNAQEFRVTI
jgi:hypothetical protein